MPGNPDFSYRGTVKARFTIAPESLPALVAQEKLIPDGLDDFYDAIASSLRARVLETLREVGGDLEAIQTLNRLVESKIASAFPDLQLLGLSIEVLNRPDPDLYELARASYRDLVETRDRSRDAAVAGSAEEQVRLENAREQERGNLEALREYGELLNQYPVLLKAMAVQKLSGEQLKAIPEFSLNSILE